MAIPGRPINFVVQQANGQVWLTWDLAAGATSYDVLRSTDGVTFASIATPAPNSYLDLTATVGTEYFYQVASTNVDGTSSPTTAQSITPVLTGQITLGQLRLKSQQRADRVNSNFVGTAEWNTNINDSAFELYDLLTTLYEDYFLAPGAIFQTNGTSQFYALPDGATNFQDLTGTPFLARPFYKLVGVDCGVALNNNAWVTLHKFNFSSRNRYIFPQITSTFLGVFNLAYRVMGDNIEFIPTPSGAQYIRLWYIPRMTKLLKDTDILTDISGWSEYIVIDAAIKALEKEESDTSLLMAQKQAMKIRIEETAMNRDAGMPDTISDVRGSGVAGVYGGPGWDGGWGGG